MTSKIDKLSKDPTKFAEQMRRLSPEELQEETRETMQHFAVEVAHLNPLNAYMKGARETVAVILTAGKSNKEKLPFVASFANALFPDSVSSSPDLQKIIKWHLS